MTEATGPTNITCIMWPSSEKHARTTPLEPLNIESQNQLLASNEHLNFPQCVLFSVKRRLALYKSTKGEKINQKTTLYK